MGRVYLVLLHLTFYFYLSFIHPVKLRMHSMCPICGSGFTFIWATMNMVYWDVLLKSECFLFFRRNSASTSKTSPGSWTVWAAANVDCGANCRWGCRCSRLFFFRSNFSNFFSLTTRENRFEFWLRTLSCEPLRCLKFILRFYYGSRWSLFFLI